MSDEVIKCADCPLEFTFTESEASFFASKGLTKPKRCKPCREKRKAAKAADGGAAPISSEAPKRTQWVGGGGEEEAPRKFKGRDRRNGRGREF